MGTYLVTVPADSYPAVLFRLKCDVTAGPATTHDIACYVFAVGKGVVRMLPRRARLRSGSFILITSLERYRRS